jgi:hypothetical protein
MQSLAWLIAASGMLSPPPDTADSMARLPSRGLGPTRPAAIAFYEPTLRLGDDGPLSPQRPKAVEFSQAYYTRLAIHRYASYAMIPLFVTEYAIGRSLYNHPDTLREGGALRTWHGLTAGGIYVLYGVNTLTGAWNLWEGRAVKEGRTRRTIHSALMFISGAGFVATAMLAPDDDFGEGGTLDRSSSRRATHRTVAMVSMSTALVGDLMMLIGNKH